MSQTLQHNNHASLRTAIMLFSVVLLKGVKSERVARQVNAVGAAYLLCRQH